MEEQESVVRRFLMDFIGYGKVMMLLKGKKPLDETVVGFMNGTVLGMSGNDAKHYDYNIWNLPVVPMIKPNEQSVEDLAWQIKTEALFEKKKPTQIAEVVRKLHEEAFPEAALSEKNVDGTEKVSDNTFRVIFSNGNIYVGVRGYHTVIEKRLFIARFDLPPDEVNGINEAVTTYGRMVKGGSLQDVLKAFSRQDIRGLSSEPVTNRTLLDRIKEDKGKKSVGDTGLLKTLKDAKPPLYDGGIYEPGSLFAHPIFGYGIVTEISGDVAACYFPKHSERMNLLCKNPVIF